MSQIDCEMKAKSYCSVNGCINNNRDRSLTFFALPKEIKRRRQWLTLIDRQELFLREDMKRKTYLVCSVHFDDSSIKTIKHLKEDAIPTLFLPNQSQNISTPCTTTEIKVIITEYANESVLLNPSQQTTFGLESGVQLSTKRIKIEEPGHVIEDSVLPFVLLDQSEGAQCSTDIHVEAAEYVNGSDVQPVRHFLNQSEKAAFSSASQWLATDIKVEDAGLSDKMLNEAIEEDSALNFERFLATMKDKKQCYTFGTQTEEDDFKVEETEMSEKIMNEAIEEEKALNFDRFLATMKEKKQCYTIGTQTEDEDFMYVDDEIPRKIRLQHKLRELKLKRKMLDLEIVNVIQEIRENDRNFYVLPSRYKRFNNN